MKRIFKWDSDKADKNYRKHKISFEQAALVFNDPLAFSVQDRVEDGEQRWQTIGMVGGALVLLVAHTVQINNAEVIRIISARPVTTKERKRYEHS
jgi:uncharacterized DUF497 family protein